MRHKNLFNIMRMLALASLTVSCTIGQSSSSLYNDLGEMPGINSITEEMLWQIASDDRIVDRFIHTDLSRFQERLGEQICSLSGGPCTYAGASMRQVHGGQHIREAEFNALVEHLLAAMESLDLSIATQNRLLRVLAPMQPDIIEL